jgi:hypothetical protein
VTEHSTHGPREWPYPIPGAFWIALGMWYLVKFRNPDARSKHVEYFTAKRLERWKGPI